MKKRPLPCPTFNTFLQLITGKKEEALPDTVFEQDRMLLANLECYEQVVREMNKTST